MQHGQSSMIRALLITLILAVGIACANAPVRRITWEVLDSDYINRRIVIKDTLGLEGIHILRVPVGGSMPFKGQWCEGFKDGCLYAIKIGGTWYFW
jgi:hypothetical protein